MNETTQTADTKPETGWGNPNPFSARSKFHCFQSNGLSLCGKWARIRGTFELEEGKDDHPDNCVACKRLIHKYRKAKGEAQ